MSTETKTTAQIGYSRSANEITDFLSKKGPVLAFTPLKGSRAQEYLSTGKLLEEGVFQNSPLFDLTTDNTQLIDEKRRRYDLPIVLTAAEMMVENAREEKEWITAQLSLLEVRASYAQAVMVESARQWHAVGVSYA